MTLVRVEVARNSSGVVGWILDREGIGLMISADGLEANG